MGVVYKHTLPNNKSYIGITKHTMEHRLKAHLNNKNSSFFAKAIREYGAESLNSEVLFVSDNIEELKAKEIFFIALYDSHYTKNGYNRTLGGDNYFDGLKGKSYIEIMGENKANKKIKRMSDTQKGRIIPKEVRDKMSKNHSNVKGSNNPSFKRYIFLTPDDSIIYGYEGLINTIKQYKIPMTLFSDKPLKNKSVAEGWSYIEVDNFDAECYNKLKEVQYNFWYNIDSPQYKYDHKFSVEVKHKFKNYCVILLNNKEIKEWCKSNNHSYTRFCDLRRGKTIGNNSSLFEYEINFRNKNES